MKKPHLLVETLEDRSMPAVFGIPFNDPKHLTLSFVPDGTQVGTATSRLFQVLNSQKPSSVWQRDILRAVQAWTSVADINVGLVADGGQPLGITGKSEGDPRFGTIRIAARPLDNGVFAIAVPSDPYLSNTWSGDIILNSNASFYTTKTDLFSIMLHELGHAFGLDGNANPASVMYQTAITKRIGLSSIDVSNIVALYGAHSTDANDLKGKPNDVVKEATRINYENTGIDAWTGTTPLAIFGDVSNRTDIDHFSFKNLTTYSGPVTFQLKTDGISLLAARFSIVDAKNKVLATTSSSGIAGSTLSLRLNASTPGATYYLRIESANRLDVFSTGRYGLAVKLDALNEVSQSRLNEVLTGPGDVLNAKEADELFSQEDHLYNEDEGLDDDFAFANNLRGARSYSLIGSLDSATDVDFYRIRGPQFVNRGLGVMSIVLAPEFANGVLPQVQLFDKSLQPLSAEILSSNAQGISLQLTNIASNADIYVKVLGTEGMMSGNYSMDVKFIPRSAVLNTWAQGTTSSSQSYTLYVAQPQLFYLLMSSQNAGLQTRITDLQGNEVYNSTTAANQLQSSTPVLINPGEYRITFSSTSPGTSVGYLLKGTSLTDPIGSVLNSSSTQPQYQDPGGGYNYPDGTRTNVPFIIVASIT